MGILSVSLVLASSLSTASPLACENLPGELCKLAENSCSHVVKGDPINGKVTIGGGTLLNDGTMAKYKLSGDGYVNVKTINIQYNEQAYALNCQQLLTSIAAEGAPQGGYTFALPGNQAYNILPGNLYLPAQNSGYIVSYKQGGSANPSINNLETSAPRPGGYAFTLPANQAIVINPGNLRLPGNAEGYSIIYANPN